LPAPKPKERINGEDETSWNAARGHFDRASDWRDYFLEEFAQRPWREVLVEWWPRLMPGVGAGLTHGLIRTTHAVRGIGLSGRPTDLQLRELATALGYWAAKYIEQPGQERLFGPEHLPDLLLRIPRLSTEARLDMRRRGGFQHMADVAGWPQAVSRLAEPGDIQTALSDITLTFVQVNLVHTDQFPVPLIHAVTAPAALRLMLPHLPQALHLPSFIAIWKVSAALLSSYALDQRPAEIHGAAPDGGHPSLSREELVAQAVAHGDEHVIKLTEACLREYAVRPDERYLLLPERMAKRIPPVRSRQSAAQP
jgi:hypothetical protein